MKKKISCKLGFHDYRDYRFDFPIPDRRFGATENPVMYRCIKPGCEKKISITFTPARYGSW